jgi:hypothetical protein
LTKSTVRRRARNENRERAASGVPGFFVVNAGRFWAFLDVLTEPFGLTVWLILTALSGDFADFS